MLLFLLSGRVTVGAHRLAPFMMTVVSIMEKCSLSYGRISGFHLEDLRPTTAVWEASPVSLVPFCAACVHLCNTGLCAENAFCCCLTDKIEEAQKELKDPKGSQKGQKVLQDFA